MAFNENTRVKKPAILHLYQPGYWYLPLTSVRRNKNSNIFIDIFTESLTRISKGNERGDIEK